jgi:hypothetical protein
MIRPAIILGAVALFVATTAAPAAQFGAAHDYSHFTSSSMQGNGSAISMHGPGHPPFCRRVCVKTESHGPASAPQCIAWQTIC